MTRTAASWSCFGYHAEEPFPSFARRGIRDMLVTDEVRKCVLFVGTKEGGLFRPRATAFLVSYEEYGHGFIYLVTAEHVVSGLLTRGHQIYFRVGLVNGDVIEDSIPPASWHYYPHEREQAHSDVAVCPVSDFATNNATGERVLLDYLSVALTGKNAIPATPDIIAGQHIGIGDEVCIPGLFRSHYGRQRNIPVVRIGNIAMMQGEPVLTDYAGYIDAYLIEARSISGLSGSPVFVNLPSHRVINGRTIPIRGSKLYLLGLVHGHFDIKKLNEDTVVDDERQATNGINTGIGIVIPVEKIIQTVECDELKKSRKETDERLRAESGAIPDVAAPAESEPATTADNPSHKEDLTRLVSAAAKKRPPADQT